MSKIAELIDMTQKLCEVSDVSIDYGPNKVLSGVSFCIQSQQRIALVGPNGSGKTTLLKCLAGIKGKQSGHINCFEQNIIFFSPPAALYGDFTVQENLKFYRAINFNQDDRELPFDVSDLMGKKARELSFGQKLKVGLNAAFMKKSSLILLDEPFLGLDQQSSLVFREYLVKLSTLGCGIVVATHHEEECEPTHRWHILERTVKV